MHLDTSEVLRLSSALDQAGGRVGRKAAQSVRKTAQQVKDRAQALAPVQTGALRSSIAVSTSGDGRGSSMSAEIGPTVPYAGFVEFGTSRQPPQPFVRPALESVEGSFADSMAEAAEQSLRALG